MAGTFKLAQARLGDRRGYLAGFGAYWLTCVAMTAALIGPRRAVAALTTQPQESDSNRQILAALLVWPPVGAISTRLLPELSGANRQMIATSAAVAEANAPLEELLWRASYAELWPDNAWLGWLWPSVGFALWHLAPQVIHPSKMGNLRYVGASLALGLSWGWVAWSTGSVRWTTLSHVVTDASGSRNSLFFLE